MLTLETKILIWEGISINCEREYRKIKNTVTTKHIFGIFSIYISIQKKFVKEFRWSCSIRFLLAVFNKIECA